MTHLTVKVKKWKDYFGIIIPKQAVDELGISADEMLDVEIVKKGRRSGDSEFVEVHRHIKRRKRLTITYGKNAHCGYLCVDRIFYRLKEG